MNLEELDLKNIRLRAMLIDTKRFDLFVVENEYKQYVRSLYGKYKLDETKNYQFHLETGEIVEEKVEQKVEEKTNEEK